MEYAFVQAPLSWPALPQLLVVIVQTLVVGAELLKARLVDVFNTAVRVSQRLSCKSDMYSTAQLLATLVPTGIASATGIDEPAPELMDGFPENL